MEIDTPLSTQTPVHAATARRRNSPPLLIPPASTVSLQSSASDSPHRESVSAIGTHLSSPIDLSSVPDNEFILLPPSDLPDVSISNMISLESQAQPDDFMPDYEAMEVEAITSRIESSVVTGHPLTRSRSVTLDGDFSTSLATSRFRVPRFRLQPRGWGSSANRVAPWETHSATW